GASASFTVTFAPTAPGNFTGDISIGGDFPGAPATISLAGKSVTLQLAASPASIAFGDVVVGSNSSKTVSLNNNGTADVTITQANIAGAGFSLNGLSLPLTLAAGQSTSFSATFTPTAAGAATGNITITSNATDSPTIVSLSGNGTTQLLGASPPTLDFGSVAVGGSGTGTVTLSNTGTGSVTISQINVSGTGFSLSGISPPVILPAGQNTTFSVKFAPMASGSVTGSVSVISNATNSPATISLSGNGATSLLGVTPTTLDFGNTVVGTNSTQSVTLRNTGSASIAISQAAVAGSGFSISGLSLPLTLTTGQSAPFSVKFAPQAAGAVTGTITVVSDASNSPATVSLSGNGATVLVAPNPASINFGTVAINTSSTQTVTLTNTGTSSATLSQAVVTGAGFSLSGLSLPLTLGAGQNATFTTRFAPQAAGSVTGSVEVVSNAANSPTTVSLSGNGASVLLTANPTSINFGNVKVGMSSTQSVTLTNAGTISVIISQATASGSGFGLSGLSLPLTLSGGQSSAFSATFSPEATGSANGSLSITSDASNSPSVVTLAGSGVNAHSVDLTWTASTSTVSGYNVYRREQSESSYTAKLNSSLVAGTTYTDSTVEAGKTYFYVARAVDSNGVESVNSNEAQAVVPIP